MTPPGGPGLPLDAAALCHRGLRSWITWLMMVPWSRPQCSTDVKLDGWCAARLAARQ